MFLRLQVFSYRLFIDFTFQFEKPTVTHFAYIHSGNLYASPVSSSMTGFEKVVQVGTINTTVEPGGCVHVLVKRTHGYAMISKFNPLNESISFQFSSDSWYAYAVTPDVNDIMTFFVNVGPFNVPALKLFDDYIAAGHMSGPLSRYQNMVDALSVTWSPGLSQGLQFSTEYNLELYDTMFKFNFK